LQQIPTLSELLLSDNDIGNKGISHILKALKVALSATSPFISTTINKFIPARVIIRVPNVLCLSYCLQARKGFANLDLSKNGITVEACAELSELLGSTSTTGLSIAGNKVMFKPSFLVCLCC
jgi:hypothetical protein